MLRPATCSAAIRTGCQAAVDAAKRSDFVIAVFGEPQEFSGEAASRAHLELNGKQIEVLEALARTGKPVALVIVGGRPQVLGPVAERIPSILMTWYPGTEAGPAVADVLFGDVSPSGKLPRHLAARHRPAADLLQPPAHRPADPAEQPLHPALHRRGDHAALPVRLGPELHAVRLFRRGDRPEADSDEGETLEVAVTVKNTGARERPGGRAALYPRPGGEPQPPLARAEGLREDRAEARRGEARHPAGAGRNRSASISTTAPISSRPGTIQVFVGGNSLAEPIGDAEIVKTFRIPPMERRASRRDRHRGVAGDRAAPSALVRKSGSDFPPRPMRPGSSRRMHRTQKWIHFWVRALGLSL